MRYTITVGLLAGAVAMLVVTSGCKDDPAVNSSCDGFCDSLVDAMEKSDWYDVPNVSEAKDQCKTECTDTMNELKKADREDAQDCIDCLEGEIDKDDEWSDGELGAAAGDECLNECFDNDDDYYEQDDDAYWFFFDDFWEDFDEHFSYGPGPDGDSDVDSDSDSDTDVDSDSDGDTDMWCDGYEGTDECCITYDVCGYASDGYCDCDGYCGWDYEDCAL